MTGISKSSKSIPKKEYNQTNQAFHTSQGVKSQANIMGLNPSFANLGNIPHHDLTVNYTSSQKNIKLKFDKTTNLANISSLASKQTNNANFSNEGRYKKKNSDNEGERKKMSSQSGRNQTQNFKNALSLTTGNVSKI